MKTKYKYTRRQVLIALFNERKIKASLFDKLRIYLLAKKIKQEHTEQHLEMKDISKIPKKIVYPASIGGHDIMINKVNEIIDYLSNKEEK